MLLLFQGIAWIDQDSFRIFRLRTDLLKPQSKIRLQQQTTEISYNPVQFTKTGLVAWLPSQVAVTVQWAGKKYRNVHRYSDFKLFNAETREKTSIPAPEPPQP